MTIHKNEVSDVETPVSPALHEDFVRESLAETSNAILQLAIWCADFDKDQSSADWSAMTKRLGIPDRALLKLVRIGNDPILHFYFSPFWSGGKAHVVFLSVSTYYNLSLLLEKEVAKRLPLHT